jgi:Flp pilus assembly protein TadG
MSGRVRRWWTRSSSERGQAIVETALVLPVLVLIVFGSLEFGRVVNAWSIVTQASREGARMGAVNCARDPLCGTQVDTAITNALVGLDAGSATVNYTVAPYASGDRFRVQIDYPVTIVTPLIGAFFGGGTVTVHGDTSMRLE